MFIVLFLLFTATPARANLVEGLVGWWKMEEATGANVIDSTIYGNTGTPVNNPVLTSNCARGKCLNFNATTQYINVPTSNSLALTGDMSISAWINISTCGSFHSILGKTNANVAAPYDFYLVNGNCQPNFWRGNGVLSNNFIGIAAPALGVWQHIAVTMMGTTVTHYLNGVPNGSGVVNTTIGDAGTALKIGSRDDLFIHLNGNVDDVRVYNRALTQQEITDLYSKGAHLYGALIRGVVRFNH